MKTISRVGHIGVLTSCRDSDRKLINCLHADCTKLNCAVVLDSWEAAEIINQYRIDKRKTVSVRSTLTDNIRKSRIADYERIRVDNTRLSIPEWLLLNDLPAGLYAAGYPPYIVQDIAAAIGGMSTESPTLRVAIQRFLRVLKKQKKCTYILEDAVDDKWWQGILAIGKDEIVEKVLLALDTRYDTSNLAFSCPKSKKDNEHMLNGERKGISREQLEDRLKAITVKEIINWLGEIGGDPINYAYANCNKNESPVLLIEWY